MYVAGLVIPVPEEKLGAYREWAENGAKIFRDYGCLEIIESWEDFLDAHSAGEGAVSRRTSNEAEPRTRA